MYTKTYSNVLGKNMATNINYSLIVVDIVD